MGKHANFRRKGTLSIAIALGGGGLVLSSLLWYQYTLAGDPVITAAVTARLEEMAYVSLGFIFLGLAMAISGITFYLRIGPQNQSTEKVSMVSQLSLIIADKKSFEVFSVASIGYSIFLSFVSGTLIFQPAARVSQTYGVSVPSILPVLCCGTFGQMPQFVVYLTQEFAALIIPSNIVLLFIVSWLVGLNAAVANFAYSLPAQQSGARWLTGLGALLGLFAVCPTCAGLFFLSTSGLAVSIGLGLATSSIQTFFIAASIPILVAAPLLAIRKKSFAQACCNRTAQNSS